MSTGRGRRGGTRGPAQPADTKLPPTFDETITIDAMAAGGDAIGRLADGRVVFVAGALPGEQVRVEVTRGRDYARGALRAVDQPSVDRVEPPCPSVAAGCGGCGWQHISPAAQRTLRRAIVVDALRRIGRRPDAEALVESGPELPATAYRTTARLALHRDGGLGFRAHRSRTVVPIPASGCLVARPELNTAIAAWGGLRLPVHRDDPSDFEDEVQVRVSLANGGTDVARLGRDGRDGLSDGPHHFIVESVAGVSLRISRRSFFQAGPESAEALVRVVGDALRERIDPKTTTLIDLYGGVGLFGATVGKTAAHVIVVEGSVAAADDARVNLAGRIAQRTATVDHADVNRWHPPHDLGADTVVIADPSRSGLGTGGVAAVQVCRPECLVLVSCDAAAFARDSVLLSPHFTLRKATVLDLFGHTPHVEVVSVYHAVSGVSSSTR